MVFTRSWHRLAHSWRTLGLGTHSTALRRALSPLIWLPTAIVITNYGYTLKSVRGRSMQPALNPDWSQWRDIVLFDRYSIHTARDWQRGDIVALRSPISPDTLLVKRIIAIEGDTVKTLPPYPDTEVRIPEGHLWVEGDERFHSDDSNLFGPVPCGLLDAKLVYVVWPLARLGPLELPPAPDARAPRGPAWRRDMAALEREQWRRSRVTVGNTSASV